MLAGIVNAVASTADHQCSLAAQICRPAVGKMMKTETSLQADMETSKKLLEEVSRKMDVCLSNLHILLKGSRQVYAVIHQFSGLLKFRKFCFKCNHDTPLICTLLGALQGEGRGGREGERGSDEPSCAGRVGVSQTYSLRSRRNLL